MIMQAYSDPKRNGFQDGPGPVDSQGAKMHVFESEAAARAWYQDGAS